MDLFGPLKTSNSGKKYVMVITDAFSKYVEIMAIPDKQKTLWLKHYSPNGCVDTDYQVKLCQMEEKNFAMKL